MERNWYTISNVEEVLTPSIAVYPDRIEENIRRMVSMAGGPARLRPHIKTHKIPETLRLQLQQGITKFKCATIAEAEMAAVAGAKDILLAYQPVGPNIARLVQLRHHFPEVRFSTIADDIPTIRQLGSAFEKGPQPLPVYMDIDCGMGRSGVAPGDEGFEVYQEITTRKGLEAAGFHAYDGHIHEREVKIRERVCRDAFLPIGKLKRDIETAGMKVPVTVAGGTPTFPFHAHYPDRECSPGTSVLWDYGYQEHFPDLEFLIAAVVITRVVSKPRHNLLCLDLGHKAVASESPAPRVIFPAVPEGKPVLHNEEHLLLETRQAPNFEVGQPLYGFPIHICPTVALHDFVVVVRNSAARELWTVAARTRLLSI